MERKNKYRVCFGPKKPVSKAVGSKMPRYRLFGDSVKYSTLLNSTGEGNNSFYQGNNAFTEVTKLFIKGTILLAR